jgi:hypothetical protein
MLAVGDSASDVRIYDASSGSLLKSFPGHPEQCSDRSALEGE